MSEPSEDWMLASDPRLGNHSTIIVAAFGDSGYDSPMRSFQVFAVCAALTQLPAFALEPCLNIETVFQEIIPRGPATLFQAYTSSFLFPENASPDYIRGVAATKCQINPAVPKASVQPGVFRQQGCEKVILPNGSCPIVAFTPTSITIRCNAPDLIEGSFESLGPLFRFTTLESIKIGSEIHEVRYDLVLRHQDLLPQDELEKVVAKECLSHDPSSKI